MRVELRVGTASTIKFVIGNIGKRWGSRQPNGSHHSWGGLLFLLLPLLLFLLHLLSIEHTHTHSYIIYIYIYMCVCVCVFLYLYFPHRFISMMCPFLPTWWMLELRRRRRRIGVWRRCAMKYMTSHRSSRVIGSRFEFVVVAVATVRPSQGLMLSPPLCLTFAMIHLFGSVFLLSIHLKVVEGWKEVEVSHGR